MWVSILVAWAALSGPGAEVLDSIVPRDELAATVRATLPGDGRCLAKVMRDWRVAGAVYRIPMNGFELFTVPPPAGGGGGGGVYGGGPATGGRSLAFFVMVHSCRGLGRLLRRLAPPPGSGDTAFVVVNVDASSPAAAARCAARAAAADFGGRLSAALLDPPVDTEWGSWEMVEAEHRAMLLALRSAPAWSHFVVLSGSDYPLVAAEAVFDFFAAPGVRGRSFFYENEMPPAVKATTLTQLTSVCAGVLFHLGFRAEVPPSSYFVMSNTWKFWSRSFVEYVAADPDALFEPLLRLLALTPSVDEVFWATLHRNSPHSPQVAAIHPRDFFTFYWPADDEARVCPARIVNSPVQWYCPKRPFSLELPADLARVARVPSLFVRKVASKELKAAVDEWVADPASRPQFANHSRPHAVVASAAARGDGDGDSCPSPRGEQPSFVFDFRQFPPPAGAVDVQKLLQWQWRPLVDRAAAGAVPSFQFLLTDCSTFPNEVPPSCRIRPVADPTLCLTAQGNEVRRGALVGFVPCSQHWLEPQLFHVRDHLVSASKVSVHQYATSGGLCVRCLRNGHGLENTVLRECNSSSELELPVVVLPV
ncbi:Beta-1 [Diplonema papillatum]|nr:Beta-1 [Diplonema papillatum]